MVLQFVAFDKALPKWGPALTCSTPLRATSSLPVAAAVKAGVCWFRFGWSSYENPRRCLDELFDDLQAELRSRPYDLVCVAGGWQLRTKPRLAAAIRAAHDNGLRHKAHPADPQKDGEYMQGSGDRELIHGCPFALPRHSPGATKAAQG